MTKRKLIQNRRKEEGEVDKKETKIRMIREKNELRTMTMDHLFKRRREIMGRSRDQV